MNNLDTLIAYLKDSLTYDLSDESELYDLCLKHANALIDRVNQDLFCEDNDIDPDHLAYCLNHIHSTNPREISRWSMGGFAYYGETPIGDTWAIMISYAPIVASLLEDSNWEVISEDMLKRFPNDTTVETFSSWLTPTENLMVHMIDDFGVPTPASQAIRKWLDKLEDYPVADDDHYSQKESDAEFDSVQQEMRYLGAASHEDMSVSSVLHWLWDHNHEAVEGYYSQDDIKSACISLGLLESEDNDD